MTERRAVVIGGGLAGVEAASQLSRSGIEVTLYEMKPARFSPAHRSEGLAELVCSNSLKAERLGSAAGLLKAEMRLFGSVCLVAADKARVPAGGALAVDRDVFSELITAAIEADPRIEVVRREITDIPEDTVTVIAAGPLASDALSRSIERVCGELLSFYDAAAPVVMTDSVIREETFSQSRYGRGGEDDYLNCPMDKAQYEAFYDALIHAETALLHSFDKGDVYEGCMPVEVLAKRGVDSLRYGPLKPVGLRDPRTGHRPWANLQLRRENSAGTLCNLVGFQTNLKFSEQQRVFSMIPALKSAEFVRYGVMHRNTFLNAPKILKRDFSVKNRPNLYFAGQITGVEGYMESAGSGLLAGQNAAKRILGEEPLILPELTMLGALAAHVTDDTPKSYQPMGAAFGLLPPLAEPIRDKRERYEALARRSLMYLETLLEGGGKENPCV